MSKSKDRFNLRVAALYRWLLGIIGAGGIIFGVFMLNEISGSTYQVDILILSGIWVFIIGGVFLLWAIFQVVGHLYITHEGLRIDTIEHYGLAYWDNIEDIGERTAFGQSGLGIVLKDVDRYLMERHRLPRSKKSWLQPLFMILVRLSVSNQSKSSQAITGLKKGASEADMLKWGYDNQQAHLFFARSSFANYASAQLAITKAFKAARSSEDMRDDTTLFPETAEPLGKEEQIPPGYKACPMCAEPVRAQARICRFCRHEFVD